jgi:hypothetical protein
MIWLYIIVCLFEISQSLYIVDGINLAKQKLKQQSSLNFNRKMIDITQISLKKDTNEINQLDQFFPEYTDQLNQNQNILQLKALFLLKIGMLYESHEIIQRLPSSTIVAYIHSLIHRFEGENYGENNLSGFSNSGYWLDEIGDKFPIYSELIIYAKNIYSAKYSKHENLKMFIEKVNDSWRPLTFLNLCIKSIRSKVS